MNSLPEIWMCFCAIAFVTGNSLVQGSDKNILEDVDVNKNILRRGLQMLRLGKRSTDTDSLSFGHEAPRIRVARSIDDQGKSQLPSNDLQAVLASIFDQPRDESRRQPPLPRYGRDSSSNNVNGRLLVDAISDDSGIYPSDFFPFSSPRLFFRPAPRGGRYKRSFPLGRFAYGDYFLQDGAGRTRSVNLPIFGNIMDDVASLHPKAVPRPRIGRYQNDQAGDSFQTKTA